MHGWKIGWLIFRCYVSFREGPLFYEKKCFFFVWIESRCKLWTVFWLHFVGVLYSRHSFRKRSVRSRLGIILGTMSRWNLAESIGQVVFYGYSTFKWQNGIKGGKATKYRWKKSSGEPVGIIYRYRLCICTTWKFGNPATFWYSPYQLVLTGFLNYQQYCTISHPFQLRKVKGSNQRKLFLVKNGLPDTS